MQTFDAPRPTGHPVWLELPAPDATAAVAFYQRVFGWTWSDAGPRAAPYRVARVEDRPVAAIGGPADDGAPPAWRLFFAADDVDAATAEAERRGAATQDPPVDVMNEGRRVLLRDPGGAVFGLWQARECIGAGVAHHPGAMAWCDLMTPDADAAQAFYAGLLGLASGPMEGAGAPYYVLRKDEAAIGGVLQTSDGHGAEPARWRIYLQVEDADHTAAKIARAGGDVTTEPFDTPFGRVATARDPFGATFSFIRPPTSA